ncbi:hypothetical protein NECID01_1627 [Nematocida sp. AWRm77]|nr:hypothetical protein NECID01_1627 [Nematocida sp. AWRm77]
MPEEGLCPYAVLGLHRSATRKEVRAAYKRKAQETHPDATNAKTEQSFVEVEQAYREIIAVLETENNGRSFLGDAEPYLVVSEEELEAGVPCRCGDVFSPADLFNGCVECDSCSNYIRVTRGTGRSCRGTP